MEIRERLMTAAKQQAEVLKRRENVVGITLYGSLVTGDVTQFSDVDIIAVIEGKEPEYHAEHRLVDGQKIDIMPLSISRLKGIPEDIQGSAQNFPSNIFVETVMLGGIGVILYDPDGEIASIRKSMRRQMSYRKLMMPFMARQLDYMSKEDWPKMTSAYEEGNYDKCVTWARIMSRWPLSEILDILAGHKDVSVATERLAIPHVYDDYMTLKSLCPLSGDGMERFHSALEDAWKHSLRIIYEPLKKALSDAGAPEPEKLELICDHRAFLPYHGCRCMELGRAIAETNLSLRWMKYHIDEGEYEQAMDRIWFANLPRALEEQWENISKAVKHSGYDMGELITAGLQDEEYKLKVESAKAAEKIDRKSARREDADVAIQCVQNIREGVMGL